MKTLKAVSIVLFVSAVLLSACTTPQEVTPETVIQTVIVEGTSQIVEVQVTAVPSPVPEGEEAALVEGVLPRNETLIAGSLTGRVGNPDDFNAWVGWKWQDRGIQNLLFEPLWAVEFATGEIVNAMATGPAVYSDDLMTVTIPLREGITWSDGVPFTADDIVFTVNTVKGNPGLTRNHAFYDQYVDTVEAPDDYTVVFRLKEPNSRFHTKFLDRWGWGWIMPKHIFENVDDPATFKFNPPIGTGPYKLYDFDPAGFWTIWERREDWANSVTGILYGKPAPKYVIFRALGSESAMILAQLNHELDAVDLSVEGTMAALAQGETIRAYQRGFPWAEYNDPATIGVFLNTAKAPYDNPDVRWALTLAIDIAELIDQGMSGMAPMDPLHVPSTAAYLDTFIKPMIPWMEDFTLDLGNGETFKPYDAGAPARLMETISARGFVLPEDTAAQEAAFGVGWWKYAPEVATKLLEKNGFSKNADGEWLLPDGSPWKIEVLTVTGGSPIERGGAIAAQQQWRKFGIDATHVTSEAGEELGGTGDFDVMGYPIATAWGAGPDLSRTFEGWLSTYVSPIGEPTAGNYDRWSSPEMDAVIKGMASTDLADEAASVALGIEGLKIAITEMPSIPLYTYVGFITWDEYYWTNWPGAENPYSQPYVHWGAFKYQLPFLEATGRN